MAIFLNNVMTVVSFVFISSAVLFQILHITDRTVMVLKITHMMMLFIGLNMVYIGRRYRGEYSQVLEYVNRKSLGILQRNDVLKFRVIRNKIYTMTLVILVLMSLAALLTPFPYILETIRTGRLYFGTLLPLDPTPYSLSVYIQCAVQIFIIYWMLSYGMLFLAIIFEPILRLAICFQIIAKDLRGLRVGRNVNEDREYFRLMDIFKECDEVKGYVDLSNYIHSAFFLRFIFMSFTLIGLLLAVLLTTEATVWNKFLYLLYPCNAFSMAAVLCFLGQYVKNSVSGISVS